MIASGPLSRRSQRLLIPGNDYDFLAAVIWYPMRDLDRLNRKVKALLAAAVTGVAILVLVRYVMLPGVAREMTPAQRMWLRDAFMSNTVWLLFAIVALAAILSLPVLLVALWMLRRRL